MDRTEAYRILGITQKDTPGDMKRKYRRLMMLHHPDATGREDLYIPQKINEAYQVIKREAAFCGVEEESRKWSSETNPFAFRERSVFVDYSFLDKRIPIQEVAFGKYLWDPYLEDFRMFSKSMVCVMADVAGEYGFFGDEAELFHLLVQEYVNPVACARKLGQIQEEQKERIVYLFSGAVGITNRDLIRDLLEGVADGTLRYAKDGSRAVVFDEDGVIYGNLSFDDDGLYYAVLPLLFDKGDGITADMERGRLHTGRRDLNYEAKLDIAIRIAIRNDEMGKVADNHDRIMRMLRMEEKR